MTNPPPPADQDPFTSADEESTTRVFFAVRRAIGRYLKELGRRADTGTATLDDDRLSELANLAITTMLGATSAEMEAEREANKPRIEKIERETRDGMANRVPLERGRDAAQLIVVSRTLLRRILSSLDFGIGFAGAMIETESIGPKATEIATFYIGEMNDQSVMLQQLAQITDDEDLDD